MVSTMPMLETLRAEAEKHIATAVIGFVSLSSSVVLYYAPDILPPQLLQWLGWHGLSRILLALILLSIALATWVIHLRSRNVFDEDLGAFKNIRTGTYICAVCQVTPLKLEEAGYYCAKCHKLFQTK
jgi:hypothetical protein